MKKIYLDESHSSTVRSNGQADDSSSGNQQQDWSNLWSCFENPVSLLSVNNSLPKGMKEMVSNAVSEMRRYYSRKVIDVLIKVTRASLDVLRKRFILEEVKTENNETTTTKLKTSTTEKYKPIFLVHSTLMIPNIVIRPTLDELQDALITAGKNITGVAKGVAQWSSGKEVRNFLFIHKIISYSLPISFSRLRVIFDYQDDLNMMINDQDDANYIICNRKNVHTCLT